MNEFEWDEQKATSNYEKHGVAFEDATELFEGKCYVIEDTRTDYEEKRYIGIGIVDDLVLTVIYTLRGETCRIIAARRAKRHERKTYEDTIS